MEIAGIQNLKPHIIDKVQENIDQLPDSTSVQYGQEYLLEKTFPQILISMHLIFHA